MISGTFKRPDGSPASGSVLTLALSQDAVTIDGSAVIEKYLVWITLDANGAIPSGVQVWGNDEILPANTYYTAEISNPPFGYAYNENLKIIGPSPVNLNTLVPAPVPGVAVAPNTLAAESDVALSNPQNSDVLTYSSGSKKWVNAPAAGGSSTLASDTDVAISSPSDAQVLTFDGASSRWKNKVARAPAGSNICILPWLNNTFQNPLNAGTWAGFTLFTGLEGNR